jgi:hypothetical protein
LASRQTALGGAALFITLTAPAAASAAPVVAPTVPCVRYVGTVPPAATLGVASSGWTAGASLTFKVGEQTVGNGAADTTGAFSTGATPFTPPMPEGNLLSTTLTAVDNATGASATAPLQVVRLTVAVPDRAKPSQKVRYRAFGFQPGKRLYLHVRRGSKTKGRFMLGKPSGECGRLTKRLRYMPLKRWSTGTYQFWYSQDKRYSKQTRIYGYSINIFKTFKSLSPRSAGAARAVSN